MFSTALKLVFGLWFMVIGSIISLSPVLAQQTFTNKLSDSDTEKSYTLQSRINGPFKTSDTVNLTGTFTKEVIRDGPGGTGSIVQEGVGRQEIKILIQHEGEEFCGNCNIATATDNDTGKKAGDFGYNINISSLGLEAGQFYSVAISTTIDSVTLTNSLSFAVESDGDTSGEPTTSSNQVPSNFGSNTQPGGGITLNSSYGPLPHTVYTIGNVINSIAGCLALGRSFWGGSLAVAGCSEIDPETGQLRIQEKVPNNAMGGATKIIAALYENPPASTKEYLAYVSSNMGIVDTAYAQGANPFGSAGGNVLAPILNLWLFFRNLAFLLFIVIFIVVGFMIMLRRRLNPQTVVSIQSALPGLVIGIILVFFSYFVASLIIDLSFVGMKAVAYIFTSSNTPNIFNEKKDQAVTLAEQGSMFSMFGAFVQNSKLPENVLGPLTEQFNATNLFKLLGAVGEDRTATDQNTGILENVLSGNFGIVIAQAVNPLSTFVGWGLGVLLMGIIVIALLIQMLRLIWALISAYITVLVFTIAGPLFILVGSVPGRGGAITYWWTTLLGNVLIFPAVFFVFLFAGMFLADQTPFTYTLPLFVGVPLGLMKAIIAYGLMLGAPAVPGLVKQALGVKDITAIQQAAFVGVGAGVAPPGKLLSRAWDPYKRQIEAAREMVYREKGQLYASGKTSGIPGLVTGPFGRAIFALPKGTVETGGGTTSARASSNPITDNPIHRP